MSRSNPGIIVVYALYNDVVCDDSSTVEDIGIAPFSVMYMCSDLYEIHVDLCNESSITLYKSYCTPFQTLLLDLSVVSVSEFNVEPVQRRFPISLCLLPSVLQGVFPFRLFRANLPTLRLVYRPSPLSAERRPFFFPSLRVSPKSPV